MRILFWEDHEVYRYGLSRALERLGHEVWIPAPMERGREISRFLHQRRPELVLSIGWTERTVDIDALKSIDRYCQDQRALHVYWSTEDPIHTDVWVLPYLQQAHPDAVFTISPEAVRLFRDLGFYADELPFAAIPELHQPDLNPPLPIDVGLVATLYGDTSGTLRNAALASLLQPLVGMPWTIGIWGHGWEDARRHLGFVIPPHWIHPAVPFSFVPRIYNMTRIVLCPQNDPNQLTSRTFEAMGTGGGALLTVRTPGALRFFVEGQHLLASGSASETLRKLQQYLVDERARQHISAAGRAEVLKRHTYDHRAAFLMERVEDWVRQKRNAPRYGTRAGTRQILRLSARWPDTIKAIPGVAEAMRLVFDVPATPAGFTLMRATLECFADTVSNPGTVLCVDGRDTVVDAAYVNADAFSPYPYKENWCRWEVANAVRTRLGKPLELALFPASDVGVNWVTPMGGSVRTIVQYHLRAFCPRLTLWWKKE